MGLIESWLVRNGYLVKKGSPEDLASRPQRQRADVPTPMIVGDRIEPVKSMHDGKTYESRSELYRSYKEGGVRIVEAGETPAGPRRETISENEIGEALDMVKQGYKPAPLEQADAAGEPPPLKAEP